MPCLPTPNHSDCALNRGGSPWAQNPCEHGEGESKTLREGVRRIPSLHLRYLPRDRKTLLSPGPHILEQR